MANTSLERSKKMGVLQREIDHFSKRIDDASRMLNKLQGFKPETEEGKKAHSETLEQISHDIGVNQREITERKARLEVATVEFLSGKDTDLDESDNNFRQAS